MRIELRKGMVVSLGLHALVVVIAVVGLPSILSPDEDKPQVIPVEIVQIADRTTPKPPEVKPEPKPEPPKPVPKEEPKPEPKPQDTPPPPKPVVEKPEPKPEPPKEKPKPAEQIPELKVDVKPRPKPKPPSRFDPSRIAKLLEDKTEKNEPAPAKPQQQSIDMARLTTSLQDAIRAQVQPCWLFPAGAPDAENLVVRLRITLNSDGTLSRPPEVLDQGRLGGANDYYRVAAESARRAVQKCSPLKLPVESYDVWRDIDLTFDPKEMITG
jgi:outer membrane biosynthesis protein TonB